MYRGQFDHHLRLGLQRALTLDPSTVVISSLYAIQCTFTYSLLQLFMIFAIPNVWELGLVSLISPTQFDHLLAFCLPESSEGMTSLYSVSIIRSHKTCPPLLKAFTIQQCDHMSNILPPFVDNSIM